MSVKIVKLTASNVDALAQILAVMPEHAGNVTVTKTTAVFDVPNAVQALDIVTAFQQEAVCRFGAVGHPNASLHAVRRKVEALVSAEITERLAATEGVPQVDLVAEELAQQGRDDADAAARLSDALTAVEAEGIVAVTSGLLATLPAAQIAEDAPRERQFRTRLGSHVAGRLLAASKCRRNRRG